MKKRHFWPVIAVVLVVFTICLAIVVLRPEKEQNLGDALSELAVACGRQSVAGNRRMGAHLFPCVDTAPALGRRRKGYSVFS